MEERSLEAAPYAPQKSGKSKRFLYLVVLALILLLAFVGFKILSLQNHVNVASNPAPSAAPTVALKEKPTSTPIPTPTTALSRSKLSITVENGSGEVGVASKVSDYLKGLGYNVTGTSNADSFDYNGVTIQVKSENKDYLAMLKKDLEANYSIESATPDLSSSFSSSALVIIGK